MGSAAHRRPVVLWGLAAIALWLPWVPGYLNQSDNPGIDLFDSFAAQHLRSGLGYPVRVLLGHPFVALRDVPGWPALLIAGGLAGLAVAALVFRRPVRRAGRPSGRCSSSSSRSRSPRRSRPCSTTWSGRRSTSRGTSAPRSRR